MHVSLTEMGGSGDPVLLIHGFGADKQSWTGNVAALFPVGRVIVVDLPGHGDAQGGVMDGQSSTFATLLVHALDEASLESVHLIGHSLGGGVAIEMAALFPNKIKSLSLLSPAGLGAGINELFLSRFPIAQTEDEITALLTLLVHDPRLISRQLAELVLDTLNRAGVRDGLSVIATHLKSANDLLATSVNKVGESEIRRQTIWGTEDKINPLDVHRLGLFGGVQHQLENCGHLAHVEKRVQVNKLITRFLEERR